MYHYKRDDIVDALRAVGIVEGDSIFIHSNIGFFGRLEGAVNSEDYYRIFKEAIFEVVGQSGTVVVPTFTYSFCWQREFDKLNTPSVCGLLSEMVRVDTQAVRSDDANFSVAAIGARAKFFTSFAPVYSFGSDSFWDRFLKVGGKICNFNFDAGSTFIHYVERDLAVSYRFDKPFKGNTVMGSGEKLEKTFYHFCYDLAKSHHSPNFVKFDKKAKSGGFARVCNLGKGQVVMVSARDTYLLIAEEIKNNPTFLVDGDCL